MGARPRRRPSAAPAVLSPFDLLHSPELASLALLQHAIHFARIALLAQHPHLFDDEALARGNADPGADLAESFLLRAHALYVLIDHYRAAIANAADHGERSERDDDPF